MKNKEVNWKTILAMAAAVAGGFSAGGYIEPSNIEKRLDSIENRLTAIETKLEIVLDDELSIAIYRIFQELLTNVAKHAKATLISIDMSLKSGVFELHVRDNGQGFDTANQESHHFGMIGINERVLSLDGEIQVDSSKSGTSISVIIPTAKKAA